MSQVWTGENESASHLLLKDKRMLQRISSSSTRSLSLVLSPWVLPRGGGRGGERHSTTDVTWWMTYLSVDGGGSPCCDLYQSEVRHAGNIGIAPLMMSRMRRVGLDQRLEVRFLFLLISIAEGKI